MPKAAKKRAAKKAAPKKKSPPKKKETPFIPKVGDYVKVLRAEINNPHQRKPDLGEWKEEVEGFVTDLGRRNSSEKSPVIYVGVIDKEARYDSYYLSNSYYQNKFVPAPTPIGWTGMVVADEPIVVEAGADELKVGCQKIPKKTIQRIIDMMNQAPAKKKPSPKNKTNAKRKR